MSPTDPQDLNPEQYRELESHLSKALDVVGVDHNFMDMLIEAVTECVSIAEADQ